MQVIPTQTRDYNYRQVQHKIPKQNDLVMEALYSLKLADAETINSWILARYNKQIPLTSIRRSLTNLTNKLIKPSGRRYTDFGGTATAYELNEAGIKKQESLPF